jgi:hypothetical protein
MMGFLGGKEKGSIDLICEFVCDEACNLPGGDDVSEGRGAGRMRMMQRSVEHMQAHVTALELHSQHMHVGIATTLVTMATQFCPRK